MTTPDTEFHRGLAARVLSATVAGAPYRPRSDAEWRALTASEKRRKVRWVPSRGGYVVVRPPAHAE